MSGVFDFAGWAYRTFFGGAPANVLQPPIYRIYLRLRFVDPDGTVRDFPPNYPVQVRFGGGPGAIRVNPSPPNTGNRGIVAFDARSTSPWDNFTLEFQSAQVPYIVCEAAGSPPLSPPQFHLASTLAAAAANGQRYFSLPQRWELSQVDWSPPPAFPVRGRWGSPPGMISHTTSPPNDISIGTPASPIDFVLWPHWHYTRFEFYDRYFGNADLDSPPRPSHRKRISIPQIAVEGFRNDVNAAGSPPDTHSNWAVDLGGKDLLQAVPFVLRHSPPGVALSPPDGAHMGLRFRLPANSFVYSRTNLDRVIAVSPPPARPGPERLRYYDLPPVWKSRRYYTRRTVSSPPAAGKFFHTLTAAEIAAAERRNQPLVFSLDDIVMCVGNAAGAVTGVLSPPSDITTSPPLGRVAIFNHRFDDRRAGNNSNPQGVYKLLSPPGPDAFDLPRSNVTPVGNYIFDYPDWTRMITSRGNVHDVFDRRTTETMSPPGVVGARAAVRWVDATAPLGVALTTYSPPPGAALVPQADGLPLPGRIFANVPARVNVPSPIANSLFSIQPFYQQRSARRYQVAFNVAQDEQIGRYDVLLLRCCDVQEGKEVAVNMSYLRSSFDFTGPLVPPLAVTQAAYAQGISQNVGNRWSGDDLGSVNQQYRARIVPQSPPGSPPVRVDAIWFPQSVRRTQAHFNIVLWSAGRDNRNGWNGGGNSGINSFQSGGGNVYAAAHETGHMGGMPDEYNERWNSASYRQMSMKQNLPGDPYEPDGRDERPIYQAGSAMMNGNQVTRNRYFWHNAEWVRQAIGAPVKIALQDSSSGVVYDNYMLPQHGTAGRTYYPWPLLGLRDQSFAPPAPPPPVPAVAYPQRWGRYDLFLYALGKDHYSSWWIDRVHASAASPFDAILVIAIKITLNLLPLPTASPAEAQRDQLVEAFARGVRAVISNNWAFSGVFSPPNWTINKGLIQVVPQFVVENHSPPYDTATRLPADRLIPLSQLIQNTFGINYQMSMNTQSPPLVPTAQWSPPGRRLLLRGTTLQADALFAGQIPTMLGIPKSPPMVSPPDLERIVRLVLPGARVRRL